MSASSDRGSSKSSGSTAKEVPPGTALLPCSSPPSSLAASLARLSSWASGPESCYATSSGTRIRLPPGLSAVPLSSAGRSLNRDRTRPVCRSMKLLLGGSVRVRAYGPVIRDRGFLGERRRVGCATNASGDRCRRFALLMRCCIGDGGASPIGLVGLRGRPVGGGRKPPRAAAVKSRGGERPGSKARLERVRYGPGRRA